MSVKGGMGEEVSVKDWLGEEVSVKGGMGEEVSVKGVKMCRSQCFHRLEI